jgi:hypothetical protein
MNDDFTYKCKRRSGGRPIAAGEPQLGAGSGGDWPWGDNHSTDKAYEIKAPVVSILSRSSPLDDSFSAHQINLMALGAGDGTVAVRASQAIRLSTGPPNHVNEVLPNDGFHGVQTEVADDEKIWIRRGTTFGTTDFLTFEPENIQLGSEAGEVTIYAAAELVLRCGMSQICLDPQGISIITHGPNGITLQGVPIKLN